jgi:hypothetical protein
MAEFIRLSRKIVNLCFIQEIDFPDDTVAICWQNGQKTVLTGVDADLFLRGLEKRDGLMTDPAALYFDYKPEEAIA